MLFIAGNSCVMPYVCLMCTALRMHCVYSVSTFHVFLACFHDVLLVFVSRPTTLHQTGGKYEQQNRTLHARRGTCCSLHTRLKLIDVAFITS